MEKIDSFKIDHRRLKPGLYVSRVDYVGTEDEPVTTFDLRVCVPNKEYMQPGAAHTLEHIIATLLRNDDTFRDDVIYFGPMGCLTGFYLIVKGKKKPIDVIQPLMRAFGAASNWNEDIPGVSERECGNYNLHSRGGAKIYAERYSDVLMGIWRNELPDCTEYPKPRMLVVTAMGSECVKFMNSVPEFISKNYEYKVIATGVGKVNAAVGTAEAISNFDPDVVLNYGLCGAFKAGNYAVGEGICADGAIYSDVWCGSGNWGQVQDFPWKFTFKTLTANERTDFANAGLCKMTLLSRMSEAAIPRKHYILTGDKFIQTAELSQGVKAHFSFDTIDSYNLVDMEAAAIAHVCYAKNVPLIVFKVVSDIADKYEDAAEHDKEYENFKKDNA
jgi:S-ribosylhomocysteine lyase